MPCVVLLSLWFDCLVEGMISLGKNHFCYFVLTLGHWVQKRFFQVGCGRSRRDLGLLRLDAPSWHYFLARTVSEHF